MHELLTSAQLGVEGDEALGPVDVVVGEGEKELHVAAEEGELRPQLLDRFGLSVEVSSPRNIDDRIEVIRRRDDFEMDRSAFLTRWEAEETRTRNRILKARRAMPKVAAPDAILRDCAELCIALGSDGLRGELTLLKAARALAAYRGATEITRAHLRDIAPLALSHRLRRDPLDEAGSGTRVGRIVEDVLG